MLMQHVLGADWATLPPVIRRHYEIEPGQSSCLEGAMTINYPSFMLPVVGLIHCFGGLVYRRGPEVATRVEKTTCADGKLSWHRTMTYPDGKIEHFRSQMAFVAEHEIVETIGYGFGIRLHVCAENGDLVYRSQGHIWQFGGLRLTLPDVLLLGKARISEHALSEDEFYLDFTMRHPLWGETYSYRGRFRYS